MTYTYIQAAERRRTPFPYFLSEQVLSPDLADNLLQWLEAGASWHLHQGSFFEQYECNLLKVSAPNGCDTLFGHTALDQLKSRLEDLLEAELTDQIEVFAHKLLPSQGIGIHNDEPHDNLETHRFVLQLNRGWIDENGGHLLLFNSKNALDIHAVVRPAHNTGVGFAMSDRSYHAVSDVRCGVRYTVVYSFWQKHLHRRDVPRDKPSIEQMSRTGWRPVPPSAKERDIEHLLRFLSSAAVHKTKHSGKDLLMHLTNTYRILRRWNCPKYLCVAGLFHSIYGTEAFRHPTFDTRQRQSIRNRIGPKAEYVAYLYCVASRESLYSNLDRKPPYSLRNFKNGTTIPISRADLADLMTVDLANSLEQLSRVPLTQEILVSDRTIYEKAIALFPGPATVEMHWVYQNRNVAPEQLSLEARVAKLDPDAQARIERVLLETLAKERE